MGKASVKYLLEGHDRYFYQRKVPLDLRAVLGKKKWRAPLGADLDTALDKLRELKGQHDALIDQIAGLDVRQDFNTKSRCAREQPQS